MNRKSMIALGIGAVAALGITGTALASDDDGGRASQATSLPAATAATQIGPERAAEIALERVGGGEVVEIEREREHGRPVWDIEIVKDGVEYELDIDRETGEIIKVERDDDSNDRDDWGDRDDDRDGRNDRDDNDWDDNDWDDDDDWDDD